jgi:hypothetical protein
MFADNRKFSVEDDWKHFDKENNREVKLPGAMKPSFEDSMIIDTIRAMRRDRLAA